MKELLKTLEGSCENFGQNLCEDLDAAAKGVMWRAEVTNMEAKAVLGIRKYKEDPAKLVKLAAKLNKETTWLP